MQLQGKANKKKGARTEHGPLANGLRAMGTPLSWGAAPPAVGWPARWLSPVCTALIASCVPTPAAIGDAIKIIADYAIDTRAAGLFFLKNESYRK